MRELKILPKNLTFHNPVLLQTACDLLEVTVGRQYIDATLGGGGHSREIIRRGGLVLGLDQDSDAIAENQQVPGLTVEHSNFLHLQEVAKRHGLHSVAGIIFDLGVSSHQFDVATRGFSFQKEGPLDMRMDQRLPHNAATLINELPVDNLALIFSTLGEIPTAGSLAQKIVSNRPFTTTSQLAAQAGKWSRQTFQALRLAVNDELGALEMALPQAWELLAPQGRLVVISFHSLEDRIVKNYFHSLSNGTILTDKPIVATPEEIAVNSRAKSAKLRAIAKV